ncbi:PREDICTED: uncharacterized protein LOC104803728 [Tarenaya hassleriana]|uniref:uncharacterized protein LOC104803728 n=1 Tax=Tarenaya hassleriana TaxID=28532 RepID=UPI0008FD0383|nr:PREDICTED: uncharacterized protein LOC104803728 [Tarenaya hassleriana]
MEISPPTTFGAEEPKKKSEEAMLEDSLLSAMYSWFTPTVLFVFLNLMIGTIAITSSFSSKSNDPNHPQIHRSPSVLHRLKSINFSSFASPDKTHRGFQTATLPDDADLHSHPQPASIEQNQTQAFLSRSPSVLNRIKSFNLYNYISHEPTSSFSVSDSPAPPQTDETLDSKTADAEGEDGAELTLEEVYSKLNVSHVKHVARTKSDTEPAAGIVPPKLPKKMKKSASTKSPFSHFEEDEISAVEARRPATVREGRVTADEDAADEEVDAKADDFINRFKQQLKLQRIDSIMRYKETVKKANQM